MSKIIVFDFDGTIMDTFDVYYKKACQIQDEMHMHIFSSTNELKDLMDQGVKKVLLSLRKKKVSPLKIVEFQRRLNATVLADTSHAIKPYENITEILKELKKPAYIVTSNKRDSVMHHLEDVELETYFAGIYGIETSASKVHKLKMVAKKAGCKTKDILFISDTSKDILEAKKVRATTIAVHYGYGNPKRLVKSKPTEHASSVEQLKELLKKYHALPLQ